MANFLKKSFSKLFGSNKSAKDIKEMQPIVDQINEIYKTLPALSNDELRGKTDEFKSKIKEFLAPIQTEIEQLREEADSTPDTEIQHKESLYDRIDELINHKDEQLEVVLEEILPEAFAIVRETARRFFENPTLTSTATELDKKLAETKDYITINGDKSTFKNSWVAAGNLSTWNMVHYDVQLIGGIVLHKGQIAEMATGEGKTLVATLPSYLNALAESGVHIVTVNDYLAKRDAEWMAPIMEYLGITVDCIDKYEPHSDGRKQAYRAGITYGTNNEFGFDYLRDNMVQFKDDIVQYKLHFTIVDEVDSVLIDDARTPLIISGPVPKGDDQEFYALKPRVQKLYETQRKLVNGLFLKAKKEIEAGKSGIKDGGLALLRAHRGLPKYKALIKYLSEQGIKAILLKTEANYMRDQSKEMPFVDDELYFTIDEKNNSVELTEKGIEMITGAGEEKDFFIMPDVGAEIAELEKSGLSDSEKQQKKDKLMQDFAVKSERVHTVQQLLKAYTLFEKDIEYVLIDGKVKIVDEQTGRVMEGRRYSDGLHQAIEAKESVKVEAATQTFATVTLQNFFRMYHKLSGMTGTAETEAGEFWEIYKLDVIVIPTNVEIIRDDEEDVVYKTQKEKYKAAIEEILDLRDKGRPILVGTTSVEVSELLSRMLKMKGIQHNVLNAKQHQREADIVAEAGQKGTITIATNMAGRGTDIKISEEVRQAGGLAIIGTERHDSRRVDRQLRGRAGRQGDPGSSKFYVSLEDNLMRLFGSEKIAGVMDRFGYKEGENIQHSMITKSIERAQKKVEENNFGIRKRLLEYDDVMNSQREMIYRRRKHALFGERLKVDLDNMIYDTCEELISQHKSTEDFEAFRIETIRILSVDPPFDKEELKSGGLQDLSDQLYQEALAYYKRKSELIVKRSFPVIKDVYDKRGDTVQNIIIPFTDQIKVLNARANLEKIIQSGGSEVINEFEKSVTLSLIDEEWKDNLRQMDDLKQSVQSAVYEQKDPLLIYKFEAFELFKEMLYSMNKEIIAFLFRADIPLSDPDQVQRAAERKRGSIAGTQTSRKADDIPGQPQQPIPTGGEPRKRQPVKAEEKVGRNDPCPCGSGKKYKKCHGAPGKVPVS
jgi:preprotein translocase subunit SecA